MKNTLLFFLSVFLFTVNADAQTDSKPNVPSNEKSDFKPAAKSVLTELNVNPFKGDINLNNSLNQIKLRYFTTENVALRLGFNVSNINKLDDFNVPYGTNPQRYKDERKSTTLGLNLGVERHFIGSKRVSPYIGADFSIENKSSTQELINGQSNVNVKNGWFNNTSQNTNNPSPMLTEQAYTSFGVNIVSGFDFYIVKNFFFGYEFNLGFKSTKFKTPEVTVSGGSGNNLNQDQQSTTFSFGPKLMNGIRVGYMF